MTGPMTGPKRNRAQARTGAGTLAAFAETLNLALNWWMLFCWRDHAARSLILFLSLVVWVVGVFVARPSYQRFLPGIRS